MKRSFIGTKEELKKELDKIPDNEKEYLMTLELTSNKRTVVQNRYMWKLIHEIAKSSYMNDYEVYLSAIKRADAKSEYLITAFEMTEELRKNFRGVEFIRHQYVNNKKCYVYKCYLGSSSLNKKEMRELIEVLLDIAGEIGLNLVYWKKIFYIEV